MKKEGEPYKTASAPVFSTASNSSSAAGRQQQETSFQIRQGPSNEGPNSRSSSTTNGGGSGEDPLRNLSMVATNLMEQQEKEDRTARQRPTLPPPFQPQPMMMYQARPPMMNQMPRPPVVIHQQQETPAFPNFSTFHHNPIERHRVRPYSVPVNIPLSQMQQQQMQHQQQQQHHQPRPGLNYRFIHPGEPQPIFVPASQTSISNPPGYVPSYLDARFKSHPLITETRYRDKVPDRNEGSNAGSIDADSFKDSMESVDASIQLESLTPPFEKTNDQHQTAHVTAPAPMHPKFEKAAIYPTPNSASADSPMVANDDNNDVKKKGKTSNPDLRFILNSSSSPRTSLEDDV